MSQLVIPPFFIILFPILMAMVFVWFGLLIWFFRHLRREHPSTYEEIGSPSIFWNNSPRNNWLFMKFLVGMRWREMGDSALSTVCVFMLVSLVVYTVGFLILIAAII